MGDLLGVGGGSGTRFSAQLGVSASSSAKSDAEREAGSQHDPTLVREFLRVVRESPPAGVLFCYCATH